MFTIASPSWTPYLTIIIKLSFCGRMSLLSPTSLPSLADDKLDPPTGPNSEDTAEDDTSMLRKYNFYLLMPPCFSVRCYFTFSFY